jgi:23S rRNA (pseudouridine1915-N3)-methyltransferase
MKIRIIAVGKLKKGYVAQGVNDFKERIAHYTSLEIIEVEQENMPKYLSEKVFNIALDRNGKQFNSEDFAKFIEDKMVYFNKDLAFFIGGADGFSGDFIKSCDFSLSFSKMTFPHEIARLFLLEQIYRAFTIIKGEQYHK